ncbi:MAG: selenide, water dikinase SelD [Deltaproteobacteria bacterium]|nr:selenide, water dikinase SelD [Deltaproteobacteria bacterium]
MAASSAFTGLRCCRSFLRVAGRSRTIRSLPTWSATVSPQPKTIPPLTSLSATAGCAAKIAQVDLVAALAHLPRRADPRLLVGLDTGDDAAVLQLRDDLALVETIDVFTPIVDDPYDYGRIAAANALSDVYAMGGQPVSALSFVAWPMAELGPEALGRLLQGAQAVCDEAGIALAGGHSIVDKEPKFGLAVVGTVHPRDVVTNAGAHSGDALVLTKAIGTGILTTAKKRGLCTHAELQPAIDSMCTLNAAAARAMVQVGVRAATDVTGFGLLGHLGNVLRASSMRGGVPLGARIHCDRVPLLPEVARLATIGACPGGSARNLAFAAPLLQCGDAVDHARRLVMADAQTSGGLLIAVAPERLDALLDSLSRQKVAVRAVIGEVVDSDAAGRIALLE